MSKTATGKVFGIGLSRTGTVSLTYALILLGYDAEHNANPIIFPGLMDTIDKHEALTDSQIAQQYKVLDRIYPNSKFILTIRSLETWLKSYKSLNDSDHVIPLAWEVCIHFTLYGCYKYNEENFKQGFLKHNREVKEYFKDRPDDLLIMDFSKGDGWEKLCKFLNKPIPLCLKFPHLNEIWRFKKAKTKTEDRIK